MNTVVLWKQRVHLCGSCAKGTWREGFFTGNPESYVRHVKVDFRNGASLSLKRVCEGNLKGRLLH